MRTRPDDDRRAAGETVLEALREAGAELIPLPFCRGGGVSPIMRHEMRGAVDRYLAEVGGPVRTLAELIARNRALGAPALRYGQDLLEDVQEHGDPDAPEYLAAMTERTETRARLRALLDEAEVSFMFSVAPRSLPPFTGFPELTVPVGTDGHGMPRGSCFVARPFDDGALLRFGAAVQRLLSPAPRPSL